MAEGRRATDGARLARDIATAGGIAAALAALLAMMLLDGSDPLAIVLLPPLVLVFGGTFGAAMAGSASSDLHRIGGWLRTAFGVDRLPSSADCVAQLVDLTTVARKQGLLAMESRVRRVEDDFLRRGLEKAIDGVAAEVVRTTMERELAARRTEDRVAARFFARMGGYAPTIGIIGTVVGLVQVLQGLDNPTALGPLVASAFVATLWGVLTANFLWLPISTKITRVGELRVARMQLMIEGVCEIQAGASPRAVRTRLRSMLPPSEVRAGAA